MHRNGRTVDVPGRLARVAHRTMRRPAVVASTLLLAMSGLLPIPAAAVVSPTTTSPTEAPAATTSSLHLRVESARTWNPAGLTKGDAIPSYQWLITRDDTGDSSHYGTSLPANDTANSNFACTPQSLGRRSRLSRRTASGRRSSSIPGGTTAEVVAQGDQSTFSETTALANLPNGKYMISVTADGYDVPSCTTSATVTCHVDGFKVDGAGSACRPPTRAWSPWTSSRTRCRWRRSVPASGTTSRRTAPTTPASRPWPASRPSSPTSAARSSPTGSATRCARHTSTTPNGLMLFGTDGKPLVQTLGGKCVSDANGDIVIPYMPPQRYSVEVVPPNGQTWYQTTTLEGWHDWDTWAIQGWNGFDPEFIQGGEPFPFAEFGFVQTHDCRRPTRRGRSSAAARARSRAPSSTPRRSRRRSAASRSAAPRATSSSAR